METFLTVAVSMEIDRRAVESLLSSVIDGACDYWIRELKWKRAALAAEKAAFDGGWRVVVSGERGDPNDGKTFTLDSASISAGLKRMAEKTPNHFGDFISGNDDATTADVFLQLCLFGEVVYG